MILNSMIEDTVLHEKIKEIKKELRLAMNGIVSTHQRTQGLNYKINFGVEIPRLKAIAAKRTQEKDLALALWQDNIRECKLLAIILLPAENYSEVAEMWIAEAPFTEIADHLAKTILCAMPDAADSAVSNICRSEGLYAYCGYMTLSHLFRIGKQLTAEQEDIYLKEVREISSKGRGNTVVLAAYNSIAHYIESFPDVATKARKVFATKEGMLEVLESIIEE